MSPAGRGLPRAAYLLAQYGLPLGVLLGCLAVARLPGPAALAVAAGSALFAAAAVHVLCGRIRATSAERGCLSEQLVQSQKLAVLGELSSGIAHEINTPLAVIGQEAELLRADLQDLEPGPLRERLARRLDSVETQVRRCGDITHGMLQLVRKSAPVCQPAALADLCEDMALLAEREARRHKVRIVRRYTSGMPELLTDPPQFKQVVLNLLVNAVQAVQDEGRVELTVRPGPPGWVEVEVRDDGPGIPEQNLSRIFNPFFTTKPPGQGTGLGLSVCLGIVDRLGGTLGAANAPGGGAVFTVRLPAAPNLSGPCPGKPSEVTP